MAKSIAKSCPLCLSVNDPIDMLPMTMAHSTPPQTAPLYLCRLCVIQIMKATLQSDVVDPSEVFDAITAGRRHEAASEPVSEPASESASTDDEDLQKKADTARAEGLADQEQERRDADEGNSQG